MSSSSPPVYLDKADADLLGLRPEREYTLDQVRQALHNKLGAVQSLNIPDAEKLALRRAYIDVFNRNRSYMTMPFFPPALTMLLGAPIVYENTSTSKSETAHDGALYTERHVRERQAGRESRKSDSYYRDSQPITEEEYKRSRREHGRR